MGVNGAPNVVIPKFLGGMVVYAPLPFVEYLVSHSTQDKTPNLVKKFESILARLNKKMALPAANAVKWGIRDVVGSTKSWLRGYTGAIITIWISFANICFENVYQIW